MTEIDLLKRVRADEPDADPLVLARARQRLLTAGPVRRRAPRARLLIAGGLALTLAGAFLVRDVVSHDGSAVPGAVADAGTVLADAAAKSQAAPNASVGPGEFYLVTMRRSFAHTYGPKKQYRATSQLMVESWIPADPSRGYLQRNHDFLKVDYANAESKAAARKYAPYLLTKPKTHLVRVNCKGFRLDLRIPREVLDEPCTGDWSRPTPAFLARQPRDPDKLLAVLRTYTPPAVRKENWSDRVRADHIPLDQRAFSRIGSVLQSGIVPPDLRAALYQAARKIPGIQLIENVETLDGRRAQAIGYTSEGQRFDILIDPTTGQGIGSRLIDPRTGNGPETVYMAFSYTTRVTSTPAPQR
ncbi:CU044_5270 family protein [Kribbella sp. CA-293567]|uniref:CU044_5270 family protein n=1 Tax=Kribbella sp. CA-293567 TaxID=3002436 RepID=UPI0022DE69B0|nr:CU044_5270 family protein [Kribbella sp. CA-293567]WBQ02966.1 CU044_5270 family protein [Kribbella sp. CA-293567]